MALGNVMKNGSYAQVRNIVYDKSSCVLNFEVSVYYDSTKKEEFANLSFNLQNMDITANTVIAKQNEPPNSPNDGDIYLVGPKATGLWLGKKENTLLKFKDTEKIYPDVDPEKWFDTGLLNLNFLYLESDQKYYKFDTDNSLIELKTVVDSRTWDKYFAANKIGNDNSSDIIKQCYEYLKDRPEFTEAKHV